MATKLETLIRKETAARDAALPAISAGDAAKAEVARLEEVIASLEGIGAQHDDVIGQANGVFGEAKSSAVAFKASKDFTDASPALPGGLTDTDMDNETKKDLLTPPDTAKKKLADYQTAAGAAIAAVAVAAADVALKGAAVDKAQVDIAAAVPALRDAAIRAQAWLTEARSAAFRAREAKVVDPGEAWWAVQKAKVQLGKFTTPGDELLKNAIIELEKRYDAYSDAVDAKVDADKLLNEKVAAAAKATADLKIAEEQVIIALRKLVKSKL